MKLKIFVKPGLRACGRVVTQVSHSNEWKFGPFGIKSSILLQKYRLEKCLLLQIRYYIFKEQRS